MQGNRASNGKQVKSVLLEDDGRFPNNGRLPLIHYKVAVKAKGDDLAEAVEQTFHRNGWWGSWRDGVYGMHHYHSTAHEALGIYAGSARVQFGGESGPVFEVEAGDVVVIPAGVAHKRIDSSRDFMVVGAYPAGQHPDMRYGTSGERPGTDGSIARVPDPMAGPVYGGEDPLLTLWR